MPECGTPFPIQRGKSLVVAPLLKRCKQRLCQVVWPKSRPARHRRGGDAPDFFWQKGAKSLALYLHCQVTEELSGLEDCMLPRAPWFLLHAA